jgi:hypothetical protein
MPVRKMAVGKRLQDKGGTIHFPVSLMLLLVGFVGMHAEVAHGRSLYLNGQNISSAYGEQLNGVDLYIDDHGDIFISAPQYQVIQESTQRPLSLAPSSQTAAERQQIHQAVQRTSSMKGATVGSPPSSGPAQDGSAAPAVAEPGEPATDDIPLPAAK